MSQGSAFEALRAAVQEGLNSGLGDKTVPSIMDEVETRLRSEGRLQAVAESSGRHRGGSDRGDPAPRNRPEQRSMKP